MQLRFERGEKVKLDGKILVFTHTNADEEHCFTDLTTGRVYQFAPLDILDKFLSRGVEFRVEDEEDVQGTRAFVNTAFFAYPEKHRNEAMRRKIYVDALIEAGVPRPQKDHWPRILLLAAPKAKDAEDAVPSYLTVRPWLKAYRASGGDIRSLIPRHIRKGRKKHLRGKEEQDLLDSLLAQYDKEERPSKGKIAKIIRQEYAKALGHPGHIDWKCPSARSIYRMLDEGNARKKTAKRYGSRAAVAKFDHGGTTPEALYPMEVVEIDHTWLNIFVVDKKHRILLGRPWITVAIDRYTRMIVGIYIGFEPPSIYSVAQCIKNMILPKTWLRRIYPELPAWEAYGIPVLIVCDNGREFLSESFREIAAALGTTIRLAPVRNPEYKGAIESFLKTVNKVGLSGLPGGTGSNPRERGDYDAEGRACMSIDDLREYFHHWLLAEYVWKRHSGINRVPGKFWRESLKHWTPRLPNKVDDLDLILSRQDTATITKKGVQFKGIVYQSTALQELFQNHPKKRSVKLRINDGDLGIIYVIHEASQSPVRVPARNQRYADGLSLYHHLQIRKIQALKNAIDENSEDAVQAREAFHTLVERWLLQDTAKQRKTLARSIKRNVVQDAADIPPFFSGMPSMEEAMQMGEEMIGRTPPHGQPDATGTPNDSQGQDDDIGDYKPFTP
jgi:putative transposase